MPSERTAAIVDSVSAERPKPCTRISPSATAPTSTARCEIDLSPGTAMCPTTAVAGSIFMAKASDRRVDRSFQTDVRAELARPEADIASDVSRVRQDRRDDHAVALRLEQRSGAPSLFLAADEQRQRAAAVRRDVMQLEVLDVDPLGPERLCDPGKDAGAVGNVYAELLQLAGVRVGIRQHPAAVARGLADPAGEEAGVSGIEGVLELLDQPAVLGQRLPERGGVL